MFVNPFQGLKLKIPSEFKPELTKYVTKQEESSLTGDRLSQSPFRRMVDFWFLALCLGAKNYSGTRRAATGLADIVDGNIFASDPWRVSYLSLLAIGLTNDPDIIREPASVMELLNELAAAGTPQLLSLLAADRNQPIWNLSDGLLDLMAPAS